MSAREYLLGEAGSKTKETKRTKRAFTLVAR